MWSSGPSFGPRSSRRPSLVSPGPEEVPLCWERPCFPFWFSLSSGAVVAVAYHNVIRYRFLESNDALIGKLIVGWLGAWLGCRKEE